MNTRPDVIKKHAFKSGECYYFNGSLLYDHLGPSGPRIVRIVRMFSNQLFNYCKFVGTFISKERETLNYFRNLFLVIKKWRFLIIYWLLL